MIRAVSVLVSCSSLFPFDFFFRNAGTANGLEFKKKKKSIADEIFYLHTTRIKELFVREEYFLGGNYATEWAKNRKKKQTTDKIR